MNLAEKDLIQILKILPKHLKQESELDKVVYNGILKMREQYGLKR